MGINWWEGDASLQSVERGGGEGGDDGRAQLERENRELRERLERIERLIGAGEEGKTGG